MKLLWIFFLAILTAPIAMTASIVVEKNAQHEATWKEFNDAANKKTQEIKSIVFGPVTRILGMLGIAYGVCMLCVGQTRPMITFGGVGLLLNIIPYFVDTVFGAVLPRM